MNKHNNWEQTKLENIAIKIIGGGTPSTSKAEYWNGEIAWTTSAHLTGREIQSGQKYITQKGLSESSTNIVPRQNILVATRVGIGKVAINKIDIAISQDLTGVLVDKEKVMPEYLYWALIREQNKLKALAQGSTIKGILRTDVAKIQILLPPLHEQKKIAEILSTVDHMIEKVVEAINKTKRFRKGLMLKFFTEGIEHQESKITRFGKVPKSWKMMPLYVITNNKNDIVAGPFGSNLKVIDYKGSGIPIIRLQNIERNTFLDKNIKFISKGKFKQLKYHSFQSGDIVMAKLGDPIGKTCIVPTSLFEGIVVADVVRIRVDLKKADVNFVSYLLNSKVCIDQLQRETIGSTRPRVNISQVRNLLIPLPPLSEQRKIAKILNIIDNKLQFLKKKKIMLVRVKKGFMNDLLTGRKRVRVDS